MTFRSALLLPSLTLCLFAFSGACGGDDDDGTGGTGGGKGGAGGATGGKGGTPAGTGGTAGMSTGGTAGMSTGGTAGMATGGTAGMATGGMGAPPPIGMNAFFSGKEDKVRKLVEGDAMPGYFYVADPRAGTIKNMGMIEKLPQTDPLLPAGVEYAFHLTVTSNYPENVIMGWNWRENEAAGKFKFYDANEFGGMAFWSKSDKIFVQNVNIHDKPNLSTAEFGGGCPGEQGSCRLGASPVNINDPKVGWHRYVIRFADITASTPAFDKTGLGRVDLLNVRQNAIPDVYNVWITGIELLKESELPDPDLNQ